MSAKPAQACLDPHRRTEIRARGSNGIDYVEVSEDQLSLRVYFLRRVPDGLAKENIVIEGGIRIRNIKVRDLRLCSADDPEEDDCVEVVVDKAGDFSTYRMKLVEVGGDGAPTSKPLAALDTRYAHLSFSFKAGQASDLDCQPAPACAPSQPPAPDINYLAKDYASFRQLILDRLALLMPDWREQHVPDEGIALVEILAYAADYLSYYQDAVATEAYLNTARRRISVRRHVRLLDYAMHEGCNARTWIHIKTSRDVRNPSIDPAVLLFVAGFPGSAGRGKMLTMQDLDRVSMSQYQLFEPIATEPVALYEAHNEIHFYSWGDRQCYLPRGSTSATLVDGWEVPAAGPKADLYKKSEERKEVSSHIAGSRYPEAGQGAPAPNAERRLCLKKGDYLLLEEVRGPKTGSKADANMSHRHVVRLTEVETSMDPLFEQPIVEIAWHSADALPFQLCLSELGPAPHCELIKHVSVARANLLLADQGIWIADESLGMAARAAVLQSCQAQGRASEIKVRAARFSPALQFRHLTFRQSLDSSLSASTALMQDPRLALPQIRLRSIAPLPDGLGPLFSFEELKRPELLAARLSASPKTEATLYLHERLPKKALSLLVHFDPAKPLDPKLEAALADEMNRFVHHWIAKSDLFKSQPQDLHYVVEMDDDGIAHLRFGCGGLGRAPEPGELFSASYRVGGGIEGNVGAEVIDRIVLLDDAIQSLTLEPTNPLAAQGGTVPESVNAVKLFAPGAFLKGLERAITADDYAALAETNPKVQRAAATLVWTGSRYEAHVAIDPLDTDQPDPELLEEIRRYLQRYRRIGHDLSVVQAQYVPLELALTVHVVPDFLKAHVKAALLNVLSNRTLDAGQRGFFHPDNLTFGQSIYLSQLVAAAQAITGVESVQVTALQRLFQEPQNELATGILTIGPLEVAQLDNNPVLPERGVLRLSLRGGR